MQKERAPFLFFLALAVCPAALAAQEPADAGAPITESGIWIGDLALCGAGPVKAEPRIDGYNGLPVVNITLPATLREALATLTAASIGKPLPIRVNGKIVSEPHVNEPIQGGELQISGLGRAETDELVASLQACAGDAAQNSRVSE
ncbi:hypothetical protein [Sphingopyxis sp.]|uniref:SecDF P1 head subdomain-containing protein n=1 Tax=Sphingopyxis sp. TaxID=1908224 RepID=UPI0035AE1DA0